jgi:hypothetical protein
MVHIKGIEERALLRHRRVIGVKIKRNSFDLVVFDLI